MTSKEIVKLAYDALEDKKGSNIKIIGLEGVSVIADYFVIANGENRNQVQALADFAEEKLGRAGINPTHVEGYQSAGWILLDYGDVIIHVFSKEDRAFYDLERIWRDGTIISPDEFM